MRNRRWSDNDKHFWPFTLGTGDCPRYGFMLDSGANDGGPGDCHIRFHFHRATLICELPRIIRDWRERRPSPEKIFGRDWYENIYPREYGAYVSEGALFIHYGAQTHDSRTDQNKCFFLPWRHWRFIRQTYYDLEGRHFWTERNGDRAAWEASNAVEEACPKARFEFEDYDGEKIIATVRVEEREWRFGTGAFSWLSWFRKPKISRSLWMEFSAEVGPEKGSWKGGITGSSAEMLPGDTPELAFQRYCEHELRSKYRKFRVRYLGKAA